MPTLLFIARAFADVPTTQPFEPYTERVRDTTVVIDMLPIPAGKFVFSPDGKAAPKAIDIKRFWMAKTECTWDQFDTFWLQLDLPKEQRKYLVGADAKTRPSSPYEAPDRGWGHQGFPAICISPKSAKMYCQWLSDKSGCKYRLPSEAEWEYACRAAGAIVQLNKQQLDRIGWFADNSNQTTQPVRQKKSNAWGLYDMLGNAGEWCTPLEGDAHILRGGSFLSKVEDAQCTSREPFNPQWQAPNPAQQKWWLASGPFAGFRVVREE